LTTASAAFDESEALVEKMLVAQPLDPKLRRRQAILHQFRSMLYYDDAHPSFEDPARALESAKRYLVGAEELVRRDPNDSSAQTSHAIALSRVSLCLRETDPHAAIQMARQALDALNALIASGKRSSIVTSNHVVALQRLAEAQLKIQSTAARATADGALAEERSLAADSPSGSDERANLVAVLIVSGQANAAAGGFELAESELKEARSEAEAIAKSRELTNLIPLAHAERALGAFYAERRHPAEARECYRRFAELYQGFPEANEYVVRQRASIGQLMASLR
jgi:tetratricopeptide (TPR) repeat protein